MSEDEKELSQTSLKQKFFEYLNKIQDIGQFIIFENVDLPENITDFAKVETFLGELDPNEVAQLRQQFGGRLGFFPSNTVINL